MLESQRTATDRPIVFCLHHLGGSAREWTPVAQLLETAHCVALDLPGFGDASRMPGFTVAEMVATVARAVRLHAPHRWLLAGHSMGAKIATVLARDAEGGAPGFDGFAGLVLVAGSPPAPEPMDEGQRQTMLSWFAADSDENRANAQHYIAQNSATLAPDLAELAVRDVLRMNHAAWTAWLERGSREDWSDRVGRLQTPTLVIAGELDEQLGPRAQQALMVPHFAHVRLITLAGAKHLLPLERPSDVARSIDEHVQAVSRAPQRSDSIGSTYRALIASNRVGDKTRRALLDRAKPDEPGYVPVAIDNEALATLRAMIDQIIPQPASARIDLAARIDAQLDTGVGDGWRFAELPADVLAYRAGLQTLNDEARREFRRDFVALDATEQNALLTRVAQNHLGITGGAAAPPGQLNARQLRAWFEDVRADAVRLYMGHPQTLAQMGYSGIANGGDGAPKSGFIRLGIGERDAWEPQATTDVAR